MNQKKMVDKEIKPEKLGNSVAREISNPTFKRKW